jgi:hypothetical protein
VDPAAGRARLRGPDGARARRSHRHTLVRLAQVATLGVAGVLPHAQDLLSGFSASCCGVTRAKASTPLPRANLAI